MTDRFVLIGHPVGHSVSPAIHHAAYEVLGRPGRYELADCPTEEDVRERVRDVAAGRLLGANVTVPWKQVAFEMADVIAPSAARVQVANVLARDDAGRVVAHNTDATALADELRAVTRRLGGSLTGRPGALVIGNGGAARAAVVACQMAGIGSIGVTARRFLRDETVWPAAREFTQLGARLIAWPSPGQSDLAEFLSECHLVVQATSAGMKGTSGGQELAELFPWNALSPGAIYDLVYNPPVTPFLERAAREGHELLGGLGMLVGQAAHAIELWWGTRPAQAPLLEAARKALGL